MADRSSNSSNPILKLTDVELGYGPVEVVKGISLQVEEGEVVCILGGNGSGKSTVLKSISGFIKPAKGEVSFLGEPINGIPAHQRFHQGIVYIPQDRKLFRKKTVYENLELGCISQEIPRIEIGKKIEEMYEYFPILRDRRKSKAESLSGGEQQTLALARAIMATPKLLLLDEPSAGLSPVWIERLTEIIEKIIRDLKLTAVIVEQNVSVGLGVSQRGYVIQNGVIALERESSELLNSEDVIRSYLGG